MFKVITIATAALAIAAFASIGQVAISHPAGAQGYGNGYNDDRPSRGSYRRRNGLSAPGYEGFEGIDNYCTYKRVPNVRCTTNGYGESICRNDGFRTQQYCY